MEIFQVQRLPDVDQQMIKRGLCPWCVVKLVDDGKNDCCPDCGDKFVGKLSADID